MSDRYNPLNVPTLVRPQAPTPPRFGMTDYERELDPHYDRLMEEERDRRTWLTPLQKVFDVLQRGQYVSANVANELIDAFDRDPETKAEFGRAIWEGLTGKRKGTYEDIIRDRLNTGQTKLFKNAPEGKRRSQWDWASVLGFLGDILLDPTTYMSFGIVGGSTKAAKVAASQFADDAVRLMLRKLADTPGDIATKLLGKGGREIAEKALASGTSRGLRQLAKKGGDLGRFMDEAYRLANKQALNRTQSQLVEFMAKQLDEPMQKSAVGIGQIAEGLESGVRYSGAGERSARFLGKEWGKRTGKRADLTGRSWNKFEQMFTSGEPVKKSGLRDAIWGAMNRGPIGEMRRALGFRNPYQKYLRAKQLEEGMEMSRVAGTNSIKEAWDVIGDLSDEQMDEMVELIARREEAVIAIGEAGEDRAVKQLLGEELGAAKSLDNKVNGAIEQFDGLMKRWNQDEALWAERLGETAAEHRAWYLPEFFNKQTRGGPNVRTGRKYTFNESLQREIEVQKALWGVNDVEARRIIDQFSGLNMKNNPSGFSTDLKTNLANRAMVHGRAEARSNLLMQLRELGVNLNHSIDDPVADALLRSGREFSPMGIANVDHAAFEGYVFDKDVADIIQRTIDVTGRDANVFQKGIKRFANWWKSIVTMTTGFHMRNHISNTVTQYLHHGVRAFDPKTYARSIAGVHYILRGNSAKALTGKIDAEDVAKMLDDRIGNYTIRELAQLARREGVISEATMGFDAPDIVKSITGKQGQPLRSLSRGVGNYVENVPRFQSFLIDYADLATNPNAFGDLTGDALQKALAQADESAVKYSSREAKKWFLDYQDLTDFEQNTMKSVIPFYSWLRKNLSNQISGIALYPDLYSTIPKIQDFFTYDDADFDEALMQDWLKERGAFQVGRQPDGEARMLAMDYAHVGLNLLPFLFEDGRLLPRWNGQDLKDELINATAPWIRRMADVMIKGDNPYDFFYQQEFEDTADAPYLMRLFASQPETVVAIDGFLRKVGLENGAHLDEENGKLKIDSRMAVVLQDFLPVIRQMSFLLYLPQTFIPGLEQVIEDFTGAEDDYEGAQQALQMLSYYLGIKLTDQDQEAERQRLGRDIYYRSTEALNESRENEPGREQSRLQAARDRNERIRRLSG